MASTAQMTEMGRIAHVSGSFRDPSNRVFQVRSKDAQTRILRGVDAANLDYFNQLSNESFFEKLTEQGRIVKSARLDPQADAAANDIVARGWAGVLEHEVVPFVSYPYEWTFSMLKDAALLQLRILEAALENNWTLKDATPFNVQFVGARAVFIDTPSFEPWPKGEPWLGYRQFCSAFLTPLILQARLGLDIRPLMRAYIDGIPPTEAAKFFRGLSKWRRGVLSHIILPATVENRIAASERDDAPAKRRKAVAHSKPMVIGLVQSMARLVRKLDIKQTHSDWSDYDSTHSYNDEEHAQKKAFVEKAASRPIRMAWDIGCNTGTFSRIVAERANYVLAVDGDHNAVEKLYRQERQRKGGNILPLVLNLANISPGQGWAGSERAAFDKRGKPDLILVLALVHHIRMSANIPLDLFLDWLRSLDAEIVIEFVDRHDEMVVKLLTNKKEQYADYNRDTFLGQVESRFTIRDRAVLKGGKREIFHLAPA